MDDARHRIIRVLTDPLPNAHHVATRGVHKHATPLLQLLHHCHLGAEGGNNHDVTLLQFLDVRVLFLARQKPNSHLAQLIVHLGVMDNLAQDVDRLVRKHFSGGICEIDRPFDAVTEAKLLRQLHRHSPGREDMTSGANAVHQLTPIMGEDLCLHRFHDIRTPEINLGRRYRCDWRLITHTNLNLPIAPIASSTKPVPMK